MKHHDLPFSSLLEVKVDPNCTSALVGFMPALRMASPKWDAFIFPLSWSAHRKGSIRVQGAPTSTTGSINVNHTYLKQCMCQKPPRK